ncbi:hypothetical protein Dimus_011650 [Dionaea muscipula]
MAINQQPSSALFSLLLLLFFTLSLSQTLSQSATVYEVLPKYGLPIGLLPSSVNNYSLSSNGGFVVDLSKPCYVQFEYLVYYEPRITGTLKYGSITNLKGIQVQRFFLWFNVDEIKVDLPPSDSIYFQVGLINKKLDVDQFRIVHSCRGDTSFNDFLKACSMIVAVYCALLCLHSQAVMGFHKTSFEHHVLSSVVCGRDLDVSLVVALFQLGGGIAL